MAKETYYFQHDYNARNDDKVLELRSRFGGEGYGIFWMIIETMAENDHGGVKASLMGGLSQGYGVAKAWLLDFFNDCVEIGLFYEESGVYYSKRLLTHKEFRKFLSDQGKAGAVKRWGGDSPPNTPPNAKERKGKEIKVKDNNTVRPDEKFELDLPENKINTAIEYISRTKFVNADKPLIISLWTVFKEKNFTGEKNYKSNSDIFRHFFESLKYQQINGKQQVSGANKSVGRTIELDKP